MKKYSRVSYVDIIYILELLQVLKFLNYFPLYKERYQVVKTQLFKFTSYMMEVASNYMFRPKHVVASYLHHIANKFK